MSQQHEDVVSGARGGSLGRRVAVVTGASSGIGRAVAVRFVAEGATVVAVGRDTSRLAALSDEAVGPGTLEASAVDLTDDAARDALATAVTERHGRVDVLVHSAGEYVRSPIDEATLDDFDAQYAANVRGPYGLTQALLPALRAAGGRGCADVVVVNSSQGVRAGRDTGQYAATQHAMRAVADSLREEANADGIRVCSIHLGRTATPRQEKIFAMEARPYRSDLLVQPEDVAGVIENLVALPATAEVTEVHLRPAKKS